VPGGGEATDFGAVGGEMLQPLLEEGDGGP